MQHVNIFRQTRFAASSFNELLKEVDTSMIRKSKAEQHKKEKEEDDEFSPASIWEIGGRILYGFQHGDVVKANIGELQSVLCVISNAKQDGFIVHSTQWDTEKKCWQFQDKTIALRDITSFIGHSFSKEAAIKNASRFHR